MIFMVVFVALTNGLQAAILVSAGQECLLYSLNANVGERGGFTAVGADSGFGAGSGVLAGAGWSWRAFFLHKRLTSRDSGFSRA